VEERQPRCLASSRSVYPCSRKAVATGRVCAAKNNLLTSATEGRTTTRPAIEIAAGYTGFDEPEVEKLCELPGGQPANWDVTSYLEYDRNGNLKRRRDNRVETPGGQVVAPGRVHRSYYNDGDRLTKEVTDSATAGDCTDERPVSGLALQPGLLLAA
jgi:hypothetical protein